MGLRETLNRAVGAAVNATGNIAVSANYLAFSSATYNASAGSAVTVYATTGGVKVIFDVFRFEQIDGQIIRPDDRRALIAANHMSGVVPTVHDQIKASSETWEVQAVRSDPATALWDLQIRRP